MNAEGQPETLITLTASPIRRGFALCVLIILGLMLLYIAFFRPPVEFGWQLFLVGFGGVVLWLAEHLRRATALELTLTSETLSDSAGRVLCAVSEIDGIERGFFAFKPSNGFTLRLTRGSPKRGRVWAPGVYWRLGRRIGIGGVTAAAQAKSMAEVIALLLAEREKG